jgi:amino acid adenylation domain-containing protein
MTNERVRRGLELSDKRQALLDRLLAEHGHDVPDPVTITRRPQGGAIPLSCAQQRLWFLDRVTRNRASYNMAYALPVGAVEPGVLTRAFNEVVRRHESLRTTFALEGGHAIQIVAPQLEIDISVCDLSAQPAGRPEAEVTRVAGEEARRPFDLERGPLIRALLLKSNPSQFVLLLTIHHIVSDGWSMEVLGREIATLYAAFAAGRPSPLPDLPIQYADYAVWERDRLEASELKLQLDYWKRQLANLTTIALPTDRPHPEVQSFEGRYIPIRLGAELTARVMAIGHRHGCTPFMVLLAAFQVFLSRIAGQDDIAVGVPVAGRDRKELEALVGFFVNTLVMRTDLSGDPSFAQLMERVREVALAAYANSELPFDKLVEELQPRRELSRNPLFQVVFQLQNLSEIGTGARPAGQPLEVQTGSAKFDLTFNLWESAEGIVGQAEYSTDLFDAKTIEGMVEHWINLLHAATSEPARTLWSLPLLSPQERRQLRDELNQTATSYPRRSTIIELFAAQVARSPDAIAVSYSKDTATYRQLDVASGRLAIRLRAAGVDESACVGVCLPRSKGAIVCLVAVLKAGGVYVPIDPSYPLDRQRYMLEDAKCPVLVTDPSVPLKPEPGNWKVLFWEDEAGLAEGERSPALAPLPIRTTAESACCVIYTSGSTGRPKGVVVSHRAVVRLVMGADYIALGPDDRVAQMSSISFDAAHFEIWGPLLNGGRIVGISRDISLSPSEFAADLKDEGITVLFLTTALFNLMSRQVPGAFASLNTLLFGGEAVDPASVRAVLCDGAPRRLVHVYGPTENTTFSTWHQISSVEEGSSTVPIGRPIAQTQAYVLDRARNLVPVGVTGELYLGGDGVALGYFNAPELTQEKFVDDPFGPENSRLYRSGDLVRWSADRQLIFLGRVDQQVKIRGFRVEPSEIEIALCDLPGVRAAAVLVREDVLGDRRLVAYIVTEERRPPEALRQALGRSLPDYMIPSAYVTLDALPLTVNGKVDREALPAPDGDRPGLEADYVAPTTHVERIVAAAWRAALHLNAVGARDNFFDLGGSSLLLVEVLASLKNEFGPQLKDGASLSIVDLFRYPTIATLAAFVERNLPLAGDGDGSLVSPREGAVMALDAQRLLDLRESTRHRRDAMLRRRSGRHDPS